MLTASAALLSFQEHAQLAVPPPAGSGPACRWPRHPRGEEEKSAALRCAATAAPAPGARRRSWPVPRSARDHVPRPGRARTGTGTAGCSETRVPGRRPARARGGRALHSVRVRARRLLAAAGEASTVSFSLARLEDWCAFGLWSASCAPVLHAIWDYLQAVGVLTTSCTLP